MSKPVLSIGLPVYNGQRYLSKALDSLLNQEFEDFELIVSDNGSTDQTEAICRKAAARDSRIRYLRNDQNQGATWNFRKVLEASSGEFFKYAAYDDECYPAMLRKCMDAIRADSSITLVYTRSELIDENSAVVPPQCSPRWDSIATSANYASIRLWQVLWWVLHGQACYGVMRSSFLRQIRPFGSIAGDWVVLAQLAMLGKIVEIPEVLFRLRRHSSNSWNGTVTSIQVLQWHNPRASQLEKLIPFRVAIVLEHMKSVYFLPLSPIQKVTCMPIACLTPLARNAWIWVLRKTGPIRRKLRAITGWKALHPSHVTG